jgi:UDP-N-acetylmuramate--alanine ligase
LQEEKKIDTMNLRAYKSVYFLGIGGIGMSALARYFRLLGITVHGYDRTPSAITKELSAEGIEIHFEENVPQLPSDIDLVVYTPAIPKEHAELMYFVQRGIPVKKRAEILGLVTADYKTVAVAGTHGKTTTSSLVAHIFRNSGLNLFAFLGGISKNYQTNFLAPQSLPASDGMNEGTIDYAVVEADEFDRSFLSLHPTAAIITSMDDDHLDIYKTSADLQQAFHEFAARVVNGGLLIYKKGLSLGNANWKGIHVRTYALIEGADYFPRNIQTVDGLFVFDLVTPNKIINGITLGLPGRFNLENSIAASAMATELGISEIALKEAMQSYAGVKRRFDFQIRSKDLIYIDDYAHHPEELRACISSVRELYPEKRITGVFQPHLYSRTRDFTEGFATSLAMLDEVILLDIYPAREKPIPGITSQMLLDKIRIADKKLLSKSDLLDFLKGRRPEILLTMGAGDIDQLPEEIVRLFEKERSNL